MHRQDHCPKCRDGWVTRHYCRDYAGEHLRYHCHGCGYSWSGPCADAKPGRIDADRAMQAIRSLYDRGGLVDRTGR